MTSQEILRTRTTVGGPTPANPNAPIRFHVLPEDSINFKAALGSVTLDTKTVRELIEDYARAVVVERMNELRLYEVVESQMARRVEVAMKTVTGSLERDVLDAVRKRIIERAIAAAEAVPLVVHVDAGAGADGVRSKA